MRFLIVAALLVVAPIAHADEVRVDRIDVLDTGIFKVTTGEETVDPNAPTGTISAVTTAINVKATTDIAAELGLEFGLRYVVVGAPAGAAVPLDFVITYPAPGLVDPADPKPLLESRYTKEKEIGHTVYLGYGFENDWEIVPGTWTFEIWFEGRKLASQSFAVSK